jgi:hypothetical protein
MKYISEDGNYSCDIKTEPIDGYKDKLRSSRKLDLDLA